MPNARVTENEKVAKHTAGPWRQNVLLVEDAHGVSVAQCTRWEGRQPRPEIAEANARLIAATPELLEALKTTALNIRSLHGAQHGVVYEAYSVWLRIVEEAIAKAEGEAR